MTPAPALRLATMLLALDGLVALSLAGLLGTVNLVDLINQPVFTGKHSGIGALVEELAFHRAQTALDVAVHTRGDGLGQGNGECKGQIAHFGYLRFYGYSRVRQRSCTRIKSISNFVRSPRW